jgi:hypothetical protein
MAKRIKYTPEFNQGMIDFYKTNKEASLAQAQEQAKTLKYDTISKNKHDELRREARGPADAPKERVMNLKTGRFYEKLESAKGGDRVAIYELQRRGRIQVKIVDEV